MKDRKIFLAIPFAFLVSTTFAVALGIVNGWFGPAKGGVMEFCEMARDGYIKQPANSWSNLAFTLSGLYVAFLAFKGNFSNANRITSQPLYPILFSVSLIILGAGSFAMHATDAPWAGFFDLFGMFMISSFFFSYGLARFAGLNHLSFLFAFILTVGVGSWIKLNDDGNWNWFLSPSSSYFAGQMVIALGMELIMKYGRGMKIKQSLGWTGIGFLVVAFIIWNLSHYEDDILCDPNSLLQGHAAWHILDAIGAVFVFLYYTTESVPARPEKG